MKTMIIAFACGAAIGAGVAYINTADHYEAKALALLAETAKAEEVRADKAKEVTDELFEKWRLALVVPEPVVRVERVLVRAKCPVQAGTGGVMDDGADAVRVELADRTIQSLDRVAIKHKKQYEKCAAQLAGTQAKLSAQ